jgi:uncharacterized membrane protein
MQDIKDLKDKIQTLETERERLMSEVESLRKATEIRVAALESDVNQMRQEAKDLRELLGSEEKAGLTIPFSNPVFAAPVTSVVQTELDPIPEEIIPENPNLENEVAAQESVLKTLNIEERKVIEVLSTHGGRYAQKNLRTEAGLSWLQTNRVISRLVDQGVVTLDKNGVLTAVLLTEHIK